MSEQRFIYHAPRAVTVAMEEVQRRLDNKEHLNFGIPAIDERVVPQVPGEVVTLLARPAHGKTTTMVAKSKIDAKIYEQGTRYVMYATWETMVEEFTIRWAGPDSGVRMEDIARGNVPDVRVLNAALIKAMGDRFIVFGSSREDFEDPTGGMKVDGNVVRMQGPPNLIDLERAIIELRKVGVEIGTLYIDYLQVIPSEDPRDDRKNEVVGRNMQLIKNLAMRYGLRVWVGVQAKRDVDFYKGIQFPLAGDGWYASEIEHVSDKMFSCTIPARYLEVGQQVALGGWLYEIGKTTVGLKMLKQRWAENSSDDVWLIDFDHQSLSMRPHPVIGEDVPDDPPSFDGVF